MRVSLADLALANFQWPALKLETPEVEITVFVDVDSRTAQVRQRVSRQFIEQAPATLFADTVLREVRKLTRGE